MIPLPCVIIAGGKSSRMGRDKALLPFGGFETLTEYQIHRLTPLFQSLHVSTRTKDKFGFEASFIEDITTYEAQSPLIALLSIFQKFNIVKYSSQKKDYTIISSIRENTVIWNSIKP